MWCGVVWCDVVWCGVVWCGVVWCGVVWCGVVWCGVVWCGVMWCGVVWCGVVWCGVVWCVWCGVVWCGVVWCGVVWCGVVWCGVVWCGVVWCIYSCNYKSLSMSGQVEHLFVVCFVNSTCYRRGPACIYWLRLGLPPVVPNGLLSRLKTSHVLTFENVSNTFTNDVPTVLSRGGH